MNFKRTSLVFGVISLIFSLALVACGDSDAVNAENESVDESKVALRVNDEIMTKSELDKRVQMKLQPMKQRFGVKPGQDLPPKLKMLETRIKRQAVNQGVVQLVLLSNAKKANVNVTESEIDEKMNSLVEQFPSRKAFESRLQKMGKSPEDFRSDIKRSMMIEKYAKKELGEISVTEQEMRDYFNNNKQEFKKGERIKVSHILVESDTQARVDIEEIKKKIDQGASFKEMARKHSEGPSAQQGGSLGEVSKGDMVPAFEEAAFALEPGVVSDPVETKFGYHLIKVHEKMAAEDASFEDVRSDIRETLKQQKRQKKMQQLVQRLKKQADIEKKVEMPQPQRGMRRGRPGQGRQRQAPPAGQGQNQ